RTPATSGSTRRDTWQPNKQPGVIVGRVATRWAGVVLRPGVHPRSSPHRLQRIIDAGGSGMLTVEMADQELEQAIVETGARLLEGVGETRRSVWARERWEETLLRRLMENADFKVQALRFVDVLPALTDDGELIRHL